MLAHFENPFANFGVIACGDRFIGRKDSLKVIESRVIIPEEPGNLAIVGDYRIGKSSLVYKGIMERKEELLERKKIPIWINVGTFEQALDFFHFLVSSCYDELENLTWVTDPIKSAASRAFQHDFSWIEFYGHVQRFFEKIRQAGIRVLFILDEFDHARYLFKRNIPGFQGLRELSYRPQWRVTFITTSRRSLYDIELHTQASSTLDGIFLKHYLSMFDERDLQEYFTRLSSVRISVTPILMNRIRFYCGGHPYLLEMLGHEIVEFFREHQGMDVDVDEAARRIESSILDHYEHMVDILNEKGDLDKLLQILFGPAVDVKKTDLEHFLRYGLIRTTNDGPYMAFSDHFHTYLKLIERQRELWPIWRETEIALRTVICDKMQEKYGQQWIEGLERARPNLKSMFDRCRDAQKKEKTLFGSRASHNLIDFTYPQELFSIIFCEWDTFKSILGKDKKYWSDRAQFLAKIRNPLAHNRDDVLYDFERQIAEGYCNEILTVLYK